MERKNRATIFLFFISHEEAVSLFVFVLAIMMKRRMLGDGDGAAATVAIWSCASHKADLAGAELHQSA